MDCVKAVSGDRESQGLIDRFDERRLRCVRFDLITGNGERSDPIADNRTLGEVILLDFSLSIDACVVPPVAYQRRLCPLWEAPMRKKDGMADGSPGSGKGMHRMAPVNIFFFPSDTRAAGCD